MMMKSMGGDGSSGSIVKIPLLAVLTFLVVCFMVVVGYLYSANGDIQKANELNKEEIKKVSDRTIVLETNYTHILSGISDLKIGLDNVTKTLSGRELNSARGTKKQQNE